MRNSRPPGRRPTRRRHLPALCVALALLGPAANAQQDDSEGALRFLKPWIEKRLFGRETSKPEAVPSTAVPPGEPAETQPDAAIAGAPDDPGGADQGESATPPPIGELDLRGPGTPAAGGAPVTSLPAAPDATAVAPPFDTALDAAASVEPDTLDETPGVPVEAGPEPLRLAVLAGRSVAATMAALGPVADELQSELGRPVEILPLASYPAMIDAQVQHRIDGGFFSAAAFAAADAACACLEPLAAPQAADGTLSYHAVIVARAGGGIAAPADLAGKSVAIGAADSLGTRRMQLAGLLSEGLDPAGFGAVLEVDSAEEAVRLVAAGGADAAFAWSSLAGDVGSGYSRGTLADVVRSGMVSMGSLAVIWSSLAIGHSPFAVLRTLPEADKERLKNYLTGLSAMNPVAYDVLDPFYGGGYAAVDPHDYASLETLLAQDVDAIRLPAAPATTGATGASEPLPASAEAPPPN